ncbi:MAG: T9SS type A sorting domain-containing protein [Melioribacteraceae bacterium]|nr:T9SS type A sorting domain-containing protein [Melioribacteraceae bacterium]
MKKILILLSMLLFVSLSFGQAFPFDMIVHDGSSSADYGYDIFVDEAGNKYITGRYKGIIDFGQGVSITPRDNYDAFVVKYDRDNNIQWAKSIGGTLTDEGNAVTVDSNGNVIVAGVFFSTINFGTDTLFSAGNFDIFVLKFDSDGNYIWMKHGYTENQEKPFDIQVDNQGNYILLGYYDVNDSLTLPFKFEGLELTTSKGERDVFVIKMDSDGNPLWGVTGGGADNDYPGGLVIDENDNIYFNGNYDNVEATFGTTILPNNDNGYELFLAKVSSSGSYEWAISANGPGDDKGYAIDYVFGGGVEAGVILIAGSFRDSLFAGPSNVLFESVGGYDIYTLLFSEDGEYLHGFSYGGDADDEAKAINVIQGTEGDYFLSGITKSDLILPNDTLYNYGKRDVFVMRMFEDNIIWAKNYGGSSDDYLNASVIDADGTVYFGGNFKSSTGEFNPFSLTSKGGYDFWLGQMQEPSVTVPITFEVDMSVQVNKGNFDAATGTVTIAGTMNGWDAGATSMSDGDGDLVYSVTLDLTEGDEHEFKFVKNGDGWESDPNRKYTVPGSADTYFAYFDDDEGRETKIIAISFQCNMELEIAASRFNPALDTLTARGTATSWEDDALQLLPSAINPNIYEGTAQYEAFDGDVVYYKFAYTTASGTNWENNPPTASNNYEHSVTAADITNGFTMVPLRGYNNVTLETVVNQESVIRFVVDMNNAVDVNNVEFSSVDNVVIAGANLPLKWPDVGWPDSDSDIVIFMVDDGTSGDATAGDNFWTMEVTFPIYSPFDIEYKYGANWGLASNGGANDNEGGVQSNHHVTLFKSFWYGDAVDVFGSQETKDIVNGVEQIGSEIPTAYELGQNYPNPFNPSTVINFSIPESGLVTLKVFNILGQEVVELVNDVKSAGTYEVSFDASGLTTGMYVYKIQSGNYTATKKMLLLK